MGKRINKILFLCFLLIDVVYASSLDLVSERYYLYNLTEDKVMLEKDANVKTDIASLTKIMTIIVSIENITDFDEKVEITGEMLEPIEWDVSVAGFRLGEELTYDDLLYGAMLPSGADATNALAIATAGSYEKFIDLMNKKVEDLGLKNTRFANVVGLYDENNYSSAYDMAQILIYSLKNEKFKQVFETKTYTASNGKELKATLHHYGKDIDVSLIKGSKTGYIEKAGRCLASTASFNESEYVLITLNAYSPEMSVHVKDSLAIYNYYKDNYGYHDYMSEDDIVVSLNTKTSREEKIVIKAGANKRIFYDNSFDKNNIKYYYEGEKEVSSLTEKGSKLGEVSVKYNDEVIDKFDVTYDGTLTFSLMSYVYENIVVIIVGMFIIIRIFGIFKK